jgi:ankyrin repeat protein
MNPVDEGKEIQTKGTDNLFNRIIAENLPSLEKERVTQEQNGYRTPNSQDKKRNTPRHIIIKTQHTE